MSLKIEESGIQQSNKFMGEGSYGCVYYPGINCKGKKNKKKRNNFYSENEKTLGEYIKKNVN